MEKEKRHNMFICKECNKKLPNKESMFTTYELCVACYENDSLRSVKYDSIKQGLFSRPPKYMLRPKDYKKFGY